MDSAPHFPPPGQAMNPIEALHETVDPRGLPVLSFPEAVDRLRRSGIALTRSVLEREVDAPGSGLRRVPAARGALGRLRDELCQSSSRPSPLGLDACLLLKGRIGLRPTVRDGLRVVGARADLNSVRDRARWSRMVAEAAALPRS